jgi:hypothetical protein
MIARFRQLLRRFVMKRRLIVLFVPSRRRRPNDPVEVMSETLPSLCGGSSCVVIREKPYRFLSLLPAGKEKMTQFIVLFAHPSDSLTGFDVNSPSDAGRDVLESSWWQRPDLPFKVLVAHTCGGRRILDERAWQEVFQNWVSYDVDIDAFLVTERDRKIWAEIGNAIVHATLESRTAASLTNRIRSAYLGKMADVSDFREPHNAVHVMHFQKAMDGLVSQGGGTGWE